MSPFSNRGRLILAFLQIWEICDKTIILQKRIRQQGGEHLVKIITESCLTSKENENFVHGGNVKIIQK